MGFELVTQGVRRVWRDLGFRRVLLQLFSGSVLGPLNNYRFLGRRVGGSGV